jgi:hypothetical protein
VRRGKRIRRNVGAWEVLNSGLRGAGLKRAFMVVASPVRAEPPNRTTVSSAIGALDLSPPHTTRRAMALPDPSGVPITIVMDRPDPTVVAIDVARARRGRPCETTATPSFASRASPVYVAAPSVTPLRLRRDRTLAHQEDPLACAQRTRKGFSQDTPAASLATITSPAERYESRYRVTPESV